MSALQDHRARALAKKVFGTRAAITRHRSDGSPVIENSGREFQYRERGGDRYFRMLVACSVCATASVTWRGPRILLGTDVSALVPPQLVCSGCTHDLSAANPTASALRARTLQDRQRIDEQLGEKRS
jgi:hypothetical protein